ncbi:MULTISPECIES: hypothetical protein [Mycobacteriaceae]|uniref:DUF4139 domain-containing protein n=1 Tax=Mycolicibacterium mucogenicum DSM 44124 TaxID=1226753 RepID=A0A8H2JFQ6_MYCMU|nr:MULTISPECIES: hypothetical protein [Mycobacteriaceae]KAB7753219.1 hypothetical protein MMUC44124_24845 [Mycolicibacterium mucogenicum DSM 44124]QPG67329.1 hypothetical protein C1S78_017355 [Mycolicibacterium mucogenicum DSM 44124]SEB15001.1 protein of unknown function [Mycobacterium sp. 283mftsu]
MSESPRVTRLVMYKHGMALVERSGPVDGDFALTFRHAQMKDVLKSLSVTGTGTDLAVGAVSFDTPTDPHTQLGGRGVQIESGNALRGLFDGLRGRTVEVDCGAARHRGEVIGVDESAKYRQVLVLRTDAGSVSLIELADVAAVTLAEGPSRDNLEYLLDRSRALTAGQNCQLGVQVRGSGTVQVSYVVPAPLWRLSYRLVRDGDALVLTAMGIVHNPVDEDLTDVALTLTTGEPVSFDIDLYESKHAYREVVEESRRGAVPVSAAAKKTRSPAEVPVAMAMPAPAGAGFFDAYADAVDDVETADRGEYFEYRLSTPVSLKRGGASMIPLAVQAVDGVRRELVWNGRDRSPEIVLVFTNTAGIVLEEGPAVIYEQDAYAGEAMVPFTARDAKVRLPFAKDLAVRCRHTSTVSDVTARVRLARAALVHEQRREMVHTLRVENDHAEPVDVIFEITRFQGRRVEPRDNVTAIADDGTNHRITVTAAGHGAVEATVLESWPLSSEIDYEHLAPGQLEEWLADRSLDAATITTLGDVLDKWAAAERLESDAEQVEAARSGDYEAQSRISEQLNVLGTDGPEGELRRRLIVDLEALRDRSTEQGEKVRQLRDDAEAHRRAAWDELQRLIDAP